MPLSTTEPVLAWFNVTGTPDQVRAAAAELEKLFKLAQFQVPQIELDPNSGYVIVSILPAAGDTRETIENTATALAQSAGPNVVFDLLDIPGEPVYTAQPAPEPQPPTRVELEETKIFGERAGAQKSWLFVIGALGLGAGVAGFFFLTNTKKGRRR